jgi:hypothetical protein
VGRHPATPVRRQAREPVLAVRAAAATLILIGRAAPGMKISRALMDPCRMISYASYG